MYKPFNKSIKEVSKSNAWEKAVYRYATCPLNEEIPAPKTRIEQLAKGFVFDEKIASNIQKLKEINRCIAACEAYDNYEQEKDSFQNICVPQIRVTFGKNSDESKDENTSDKSDEQISGKNNDSIDAVQQTQFMSKPDLVKEQDEETQTDIDIKGLPVLTELPSLQDICKVLHRITKIEDFKIVPINSQDVMLLLNKLKGENGNKIYRVLPNNVTHIFKKAIEYLHDHFELLQEKECEKQTKEGLEDIVRLKRI